MLINITPFITGGGDCYSSNCDAGEYLYWGTDDLGSLPPGSTLTVSFNETIHSGVANGTVIPFEIELFESGVLTRTLSHSVVVGANSPLELMVDPLTDPVAPGENLIYEITYGNNSNNISSNTVLRIPLPVGSSFVSATGGGIYAGDTVTWTLGDLSAQSGGRQQVVMQVDGGVG